jgi:hypothetical protein
LVILEKVVLPSAYEQFTSHVNAETKTEIQNPHPDFFIKKAMVVVHCEKCGKIKKYQI